MERKLNIILKADNDGLRTKGLMHSEPLNPDECAFFIFQKAGQHSFWNANVSYPISLIFCDAHKNVKDIRYLQANQLNGVSSNSFDITYVIEAHEDVPKKYGLIVGSKINFDEKGVYL